MGSWLNLYNKYRPKSFAQVIGQDLVKNLLFQIFEQSKFFQAFIFYGPSGTGKTSLARIFAKACNCENFKQQKDVCNRCPSCLLIEEHKTADIYEIDAASNSGVEYIRQLIQNCEYMPLSLGKKIYLIDECHNLSQASWNALLKTIEEPPSDNFIFIFLTTLINKIPETIISRCQKYSFFKLSNEHLKFIISDTCSKEEKKIDEEAINQLISLSNGSAREAFSLLEQILLQLDGDTISRSKIEKIFSLANKQEVLGLLDYLLKGDLSFLIKKIEELELENKNLFSYFSLLFSILLDIYIYKSTKDISLLKNIDESEVKEYFEKEVNFLKWIQILDTNLKKFDQTYSKVDLAKIIVFEMIENSSISVNQIEIPKPTTPQKSAPKSKSKGTSAKNLKYVFYALSPLKRDDLLSRENYVFFKKVIQSESVNKELRDLLSKSKIFLKLNEESIILSTDKTIVIIFPTEEEASSFNNFLESHPDLVQELNNHFVGDYRWIGLSNDQLKQYGREAKQKKISELDSIFDESTKTNSLFDQMVNDLP